MGVEIERKFLLRDQSWRESVRCSKETKQGYISMDIDRVVRIRTMNDDAFLTIKSKVSERKRLEFEYAIAKVDAEEMLANICVASVIEKRRSYVEYAGKTWEIDEFFGDNRGLIVAGIELGYEEEEFERPEWLGDEVTEDSRYLNVNLAEHPYSRWGSAQCIS